MYAKHKDNRNKNHKHNRVEPYLVKAKILHFNRSYQITHLNIERITYT